MATATWNGQIIAQSNDTQIVEGNVYFPPDSVRTELTSPSEMETVCSWKGTASYYDVVVDGKTNANAAWYYPDPSAEAANIRGYVAFWRGVVVE
jgi:uncharacterized protein (DUF427 family)